MWRRTSEDGVEVVGRLEKTADDNLWRLVERDSDHQELTTCSSVARRGLYVKHCKRWSQVVMRSSGMGIRV